MHASDWQVLSIVTHDSRKLAGWDFEVPSSYTGVKYDSQSSTAIQPLVQDWW